MNLNKKNEVKKMKGESNRGIFKFIEKFILPVIPFVTLICFISCGVYSCAPNPDKKGKLVPISSRVTKSIVDRLDETGRGRFKVISACVNNPEHPSSVTVTLDIDSRVEILQVDIEHDTEDYSPYGPTQGDAYFYIKGSLGVVDTEQFIIITKDKDYFKQRDIGSNFDYSKFKVELHLKSVNFGENKNGKFAPIPSVKIGE